MTTKNKINKDWLQSSTINAGVSTNSFSSKFSMEKNPMEVAHNTMQDDWGQMPEIFPLAKRTPASHTILLVDDDPDHLIIYSTLLENSGFKVKTANNTKMAKALLRTKKFQMVISDVMMPGEKGDEFVHWLKRNPKFSQIPTIVLTATRNDVSDLVLKKYGPDMFCMKSEAIRMLPMQVDYLLF
ncbi:MAG: response regulator [Bdellovibrionales bacterium]|nr:response regulator [Bdellovibrionales bacterium]